MNNTFDAWRILSRQMNDINFDDCIPYIIPSVAAVIVTPPDGGYIFRDDDMETATQADINLLTSLVGDLSYFCVSCADCPGFTNCDKMQEYADELEYRYENGEIDEDGNEI